MRNIRYRAAAMLLIIFVLCLFGCERQANGGQWNQQGYKDTAFSDAGFYYTDNGYLCFLDTKTGVNVYLCSRPGCTHGGTKGDEKVCDAHLSVSSVYSTMGFWDGHLYYIEDQAQYGSVVMRRNADGTAETKVAELCQQYLNKDSTAEVTEMIIADGYLYYAVTVRAIIETEPNVHVEKPVLYAVSCVDLRTGNDTELYADQTFTTLIAAKDSTVLFETRDYPSSDDPDFQEKIKSYRVCLKQWSRENNQTEVLLETTLDEHGQYNEFRDGKIYYSKYVNDTPIRSCYDLEKRKLETGLDIPTYRETRINDLYAIRKYSGSDTYVIHNSKTGKEMEAYLPKMFSIHAVGKQGFTLRGREVSENGNITHTEYYVSFASLSDGMQKDDLIPFYISNYNG